VTVHNTEVVDVPVHVPDGSMNAPQSTITLSLALDGTLEKSPQMVASVEPGVVVVIVVVPVLIKPDDVVSRMMMNTSKPQHEQHKQKQAIKSIGRRSGCRVTL